ncbi:MAG TPA: PIN domain-containing protein [Ktedonobacterales bacterium]|nr:PIN domain-containing protein [Ktedonobacterales bacterium]
MAQPFLDINILLRHLLADHPDQSPRATAFLEHVERGEMRVHTAELVVFETVFTLERTYKRAKADIAAVLLPLIELPGVLLPGKRLFRAAFDLYVRHNLPFADAYFAAWMQHKGLSEIVCFDRDFDRVPGITRREP